MSATTLDRAAVLRGACIVTATNLSAHSSLVNEFAFVRYVLNKLLGPNVHLVTWPSGVSAIVVARLGTSEWDDALIKTYEAGIDNAVDPVFGD